jgi:microcystin-dependent protein
VSGRGLFRHPPHPQQRRPSLAAQPSADVAAAAGLAGVSVSALQPSTSIGVNAGLATVTVAALDPTAVAGTAAPAGLAGVTVAALAASASIAANAGLAGVTVAALAPGKSVAVNAGLAGVTVAALAPTISTVTPVGLVVGNVDTARDYLTRVKTATLKIKLAADRRNSTMDVTLVGTPDNFYGGSLPERLVTEALIVFNWGGDVPFSGVIRSVEPIDAGRPGHMALQVACQDWTFVATDTIVNPVIASGVRTTVESDAARLAWLWSTFEGMVIAGVLISVNTSTYVKTLVTAMPSQDFTGMTLAQAMDEICKLTGGTWYLDVAAFGAEGSGITPTPNLHYLAADAGSKALTTPFGVALTDTFTSTAHGLVAGDALIFTTLLGGIGLSTNGPIYYVIASGLTANAFKLSLTAGGAAVDFTSDVTAGSFVVVQPAPFGLSDTPDNATTYGYRDLKIKTETTEYRTGVVIIGGDGYAGTFGDGAGRLGVINDDSITDATAGALAAAAYLERNTIGVEGSVRYFQGGLEPGQVVEITSENQVEQRGEDPDNVEVGSVFRVTTVETSYGTTQADIQYKASIGRVPRLLHTAIKDIAQAEAELAATKIVNGVLAGYIGEVVGWTLATPPIGFLLCDGASLLRAGTYAGLFSVIGTTFGAVDGTHFNVPDYRGRFLLGVDGSHALASTGGAINHSHTGPSHTHTGPSHTHTQPAHSHTGPSHTHSGPSHTHAGPSHTHAGPNHNHQFLGASASFTNTAVTTTGGQGFTSGTVDHRHTWPFVDDTSTASGTADTSADGTGATGSGGTGATGSGGTGATGSDGGDSTGSGGTGATGADGTGATGTANPPYGALYWIIRYA